MTLVIMLSISITIALCWIVNSSLLADYYISKKTEDSISMFNILNDEAKEGTLYADDYKDSFYKLCTNFGFSVLVSESDGNVALSSAGNSQAMVQQLQYVMFDKDQSARLLIESNDDYTILRLTDKRLDEEYLVLWGMLADGNTVMIRVAIEGINESADLSNRFLLFSSIVGIIAGVFMGSILSRSITRPVFKLIDISERISKLDFKSKYSPSRRPNEIDYLGEHVNTMSSTLESAIDSLTNANEALKRDIKEKEENEQRRKEFVSNVSHELKTPIALIQGYAEGLSEGVMDDEESRQMYLDVIIDESQRMNRLVRELLTLNQLEEGYGEPEYTEFDLTEVIGGLVESNHIILDDAGITITFPYEDPIMVTADEFLIEQVISNFLSNAIHYCSYAKCIDIKCIISGKTVRTSVFNTGDSIPEASITQIWDKFYKVDKARTREYGGSGIGLSLVKAAMEKHHQTYGVINHKDGVEFFFDLALKN